MQVKPAQGGGDYRNWGGHRIGESAMAMALWPTTIVRSAIGCRGSCANCFQVKLADSTDAFWRLICINDPTQRTR